MEGLVSLLDAVHDVRVLALWDALEGTLGLRGVRVTPFPHFSYQVAPRYDRSVLVAAAQAIARAAAPFEARAAGVALFTGPAPVLYVPVVRTAPLSALHRQVWEAALPAAVGPQAYYHPDQWVPHITLAFGDLDAARAGEAVRLLAGRAFDWRLRVDNLAFIGKTGGRQEVIWRLPLQG
jgi:2'-5' RNA ligase